jgi:MSHA pilin protein MshC
MGRFKGFTLVELIVTLVLIGVLAASVGPKFFDVDVFRDRGFFDETVSAVRYAQKLAVATGCTVRVQVTASGYTLFRAANLAACNAGTYATVVDDPSGNALTFTRAAPSSVSLTPADFTFSSAGSASADVTVTVGSRQFRVISETGFVQRL